MTLTLESPSPRAYAEWRSRTLPIVLATDGTPGAAGAVRIARLLAERDNAPVQVVACIDPAGLAVTDLAPDAVPGALIEVLHETLVQRVRVQLGLVGNS